MITNSLSISIKSVKDAPNYNDNPKEFVPIKIENAIIIKKGMETGDPTVDLQCVDENGNKYLIFITYNILNGLSVAANSQKA